MFKHLKPGDIVSRMFGFSGETMKLRITAVDDKYIYCGPDQIGWKFRRDNGAEVDEELGWGTKGTGSYLIKE
jgi:hypothetical protein